MNLNTKRIGMEMIWAGVLLMLLAACGTVQPATNDPGQVSASAAPTRYEYALTVSITSSDTTSGVEKTYSGKVTVWNLKQGYAVLGLTSTAAAKFSVGGKVLAKELNKNALRITENSATAKSAGFSAWAGGWSAWAGGWSAWAGGDLSALSTTENSITWSQIRLAQAQALAPNLGNGVKVAVIDSGIDLSHQAFSGRLAPSADWYDWIDGDATPQEVSGGEGYGHGTSVAGIIAQVAPKAKIMPLRVLDPSGYGDVLNVAAAINWAVSRGAQVINLSIGAQYLKSLEKEINSATALGVMVVASSGNTGDTNITYPAYFSEASGLYGDLMVGVGSVNDSDVKSGFSTYGTNLEMLAPGETIYGPAPGNMVAYWSGTSMAAPMVTGALALALGEKAYSPSQKKDVALSVASTADRIDSKNTASLAGLLGSGRLNLERFIQVALAL